MASLVYDYAIYTDDPNNAFGQVFTPEVTVGGGMGLQCRQASKSMRGLRFDSALACLTLAPRDVPSDMVQAAHVLTGGTWKEVTSPTTGKKALCQLACPLLAPEAPASSDCGLKPDYADTSVLLEDGQGIWLDIGRSRPVPGSVATTANVYVRVVFFEDGGVWYRLNWGVRENPRIEKSDDAGVTWDRLGEIPVNDGGKVASGDAAMLRLQVMRANGYVAFRSAAGNAIDESACVVPDFIPSRAFVMSVRNCNVSVSWRPVLFETTGTLTSPLFQKSAGATTTPTPIAEGRPWNAATRTITGVEIEAVDTGSVWTARYDMTLTAQDGGLTTPCVWSAGLRFAENAILPGAENWTPMAMATGYEMGAQFDPRGLTIARFGRAYGTNRFASFGYPYGMQACRVVMRVGTLQEDGTVAPLLESTRFTGWINLDTVATETGFSAALTDRADYELGVGMLDDAILDGDCVYHAVKVLCQRAGITRPDFKDDLPGNPSDAWDCDGITCDPEAGHTRLGRGFDQNPLWVMHAGVPIRQHISRIQFEEGLYYFGFGTDGKVWFHPWDFTGVRAAWVPQQIFSYVPTFTAGAPNLNEFTGEIAHRVDRSTVRNTVTVVGLDKETWQPLVSHHLDPASIYGDGGPYPARNFMGRPRPYFEADSRFATPEIADAVSLRKFQLFREPIESYDPLEVIPQGLNPLDYIGVAATFAMPRDEKFYIGSVRETIRTVGDAWGATRVDGTMVLSAIVVPEVGGGLWDEGAWGVSTWG